VKLRYTLRAAAELDKALAYIEVRSSLGANRVRARIQTVINLLLRHPYVGQLTSKGRLRRIVASPYPYVIFYRATKDEIVIHGVRHGARRSVSMAD
jgi:plasmid stabilization system protein ParE